MVSWDRVAEELAEGIWAETGIMVAKEDLAFETVGDEVMVSLGGRSLCRLEYDKGSEEAEIASEVLYELGSPDELRERLIHVKIAQLEVVLPGVAEAVRKSLEEKGISREVIDSLEFEIRDFGYYPPLHGMAEDEVVTGYPDIRLFITSIDGLEFTWPLNMPSLQELLDAEILAEELLKKLKT